MKRVASTFRAMGILRKSLSETREEVLEMMKEEAMEHCLGPVSPRKKDKYIGWLAVVEPKSQDDPVPVLRLRLTGRDESSYSPPSFGLSIPYDTLSLDADETKELRKFLNTLDLGDD